MIDYSFVSSLLMHTDIPEKRIVRKTEYPSCKNLRNTQIMGKNYINLKKAG